ncbi:hypothetical protein ACIA8O_13430 [Kitasatospora sp. NPDC051853]|uniref:hypothetical protein n=1 Tax=Kitasatospora sp. NPDC051853 TaxID=3364058 RepID=UPI0037BD3160
MFGTLVLDGPANTVTLYVTDEAEGRRLVAAAAAAQPGIDTGLVRIVRCPYSRKQIDAVMDRIMDCSAAKALPFTVLEASMAHGSTGVKVGVEPAGVGSAELQRALDRLADGIPVTVHQARPGSDQLATHRPPTGATPSP